MAKIGFDDIGMIAGGLTGILAAVVLAGGDPLGSVILGLLLGFLGAFVGYGFALLLPVVIIIVLIAWAYRALVF